MRWPLHDAQALQSPFENSLARVVWRGCREPERSGLFVREHRKRRQPRQTPAIVEVSERALSNPFPSASSPILACSVFASSGGAGASVEKPTAPVRYRIGVNVELSCQHRRCHLALDQRQPTFDLKTARWSGHTPLVILAPACSRRAAFRQESTYPR
jgi:hypothetical protein